MSPLRISSSHLVPASHNPHVQVSVHTVTAHTIPVHSLSTHTAFWRFQVLLLCKLTDAACRQDIVPCSSNAVCGHAGAHIFFCLQKTCLRTYRGGRAIEEATQRLNRAMDRADAELGAAQRSHRQSRYSHYGASTADRQPANGQAANGESGVHRLGRAAELDYDR